MHRPYRDIYFETPSLLFFLNKILFVSSTPNIPINLSNTSFLCNFEFSHAGEFPRVLQ